VLFDKDAVYVDIPDWKVQEGGGREWGAVGLTGEVYGAAS
jgi:hypothetical protein